MIFGSLFSGCGGGDLGLEQAGMECRWQVEIDPKCRIVLHKHWPNVRRYGDIRTVENLEPVDLVIGGFPCQPFSSAGKRLGTEDDRWLWPEMERIIGEVRPRWVIGENTPGVDRLAIRQIIGDLESLGYKVGPPLEIPAAAVNADHLRYRTWILGYSDHEGESKMPVHDEASGMQEVVRLHAERGIGSLGRDTSGTRGVIKPVSGNGSCGREDPPGRLGTQDGLPSRMDRLRMLGNAMHVDVIEIIGRAIMEVHHAL